MFQIFQLGYVWLNFPKSTDTPNPSFRYTNSKRKAYEPTNQHNNGPNLEGSNIF